MVDQTLSEPAEPEQVRRTSRLALAINDIRQTWSGWRLWMTLGSNDIAQRYRRSKLGQFWITISMALFILAIGSVYSVLFRTQLQVQLPHVVVFFTAWTFMSASVNEGSNAFIDAERYLRQERLPKLTFVMRVIWRNTLAFLHNILLVPVTFVFFGLTVGANAFAAFAGVAFMLVNVTLAVVIVAILCTRFRDTRQVVQNVVQIAFFASPIMWRAEVLPENAQFLVNFNPVAAHLRLIGDPLLGELPALHVYIVCAASTFVLLAAAVPLFVRFRERLVYWL